MVTKLIYPSDLSDNEWQKVKHLLPKAQGTGRPRSHSLREILNAIFYVLRSGCSWRMLPRDDAPWQTAYGYFRRWSGEGLIERIHERLRAAVRQAEGHTASASAAVLESQSVRPPDQAGVRGYDAGKKINGRKRHLLVDTLGLVLAVQVTPASVQDRDGAVSLLSGCSFLDHWLACIWADSGYAGKLVAWVKALRPFGRLHLEIVRRSDKAAGFKLLPKRWIVERTFGWLVKSRRLRLDYEVKTTHSEALIQLAMIRIMLRRLASS